ncbi:MAG: hypothetical protein ACKVZH_25775 [Blastocatellia bacterium]
MNSTRQKLLTATQHNEQGYALIALVGILMFALILTTAAAPMIKKEAQREKEAEMIWRGAQLARAISMYGPLGGPGGKPLTNLKDLVEGREQAGAGGGTKIGRVRFLRPSALCDPMMPCNSGESNWGLVHANDSVINEFRSALLAMQSKLPLNSPERAQIQMALNALQAMSPAGLPGQSGLGQLGSSFNDSDKSGDDSSIGLKTRPILGVMSQKSGDMFRSYYGVEKYEKAPFLGGVPVLAGGIQLPLAYNGGFFPQAGNTGCPDGGPMVNGSCRFGRLYDGKCPPPRRVNPQTGSCE